jgi:putative membrane protein
MSFKIKMMALSLAVGVAGGAHATATGDYLKAAGAGDLYETRSSQLVLGSTRDAHVKSIAHMMIADHAKSTMMVKAAAAKSGLHPGAPMLDARQKGMIADLGKAKGGDRDALYLKQQKAAHESALALHEGYAAGGEKPALREAASKIAPVVKHHIAMLNGAGM